MKTGFTKLRTLAPALADIRAAVIDPGMARRSNSNEKGDQTNVI